MAGSALTLPACETALQSTCNNFHLYQQYVQGPIPQSMNNGYLWVIKFQVIFTSFFLHFLSLIPPPPKQLYCPYNKAVKLFVIKLTELALPLVSPLSQGRPPSSAAHDSPLSPSLHLPVSCTYCFSSKNI